MKEITCLTDDMHKTALDLFLSGKPIAEVISVINSNYGGKLAEYALNQLLVIEHQVNVR